MLIRRTSRISKTESTMDLDITFGQLERIENRYETKELIQDIVPNLSKEEREFLMTGITPKEWNQMFNMNLIEN
jgi:hypothetical protein